MVCYTWLPWPSPRICVYANVRWRATVIVGLVLQQAIAMFVLKSGAGFKIFKWIAFLASDFLAQGLAGATFFFDADIVATKHWFFVNTVIIIIPA